MAEKLKMSVTANREWRSRDVPDVFWAGYENDARAAIRVLCSPPGDDFDKIIAGRD